mmetsp:Transcript_42246/g.67637  ORF Transcript_42246/g.67637 Transcript_42246/m.67637 type:complete len:1295 (+) Transcript_42246:14-3898(+)
MTLTRIAILVCCITATCNALQNKHPQLSRPIVCTHESDQVCKKVINNKTLAHGEICTCFSQTAMPGMALNETLHRLHPAYNTLTTLTIVLDSDTVPDLGALFRLETLTMIFPTSRTVKWTAATPPKLTTLNINATQELGLISIPPIALLASVVASIGKTTSVPMVLLGHKKLKSLYLHICIAQGTIPSALGELADLKELLIEACDDHGSALTLDFRILAALRRLEFLRLDHVKVFNLTGSDSRPLEQLSTIRISSGLTDSVELVLESIFSMAPNARVLFMDNNQLVGQLPENLSAVSPLLAELLLPRNQINGTIPGAWFDSFPKLTMIDLSNNNLTGPLPPSLSDLELRSLKVNGNELAGEIGGFIPQKLEVLALHDNSFTSIRNDFIENVIKHVADSATWVVQLTLENNPWDCTCSLYTVMEAIRSAQTRVILYDDPKCAPVNGYGNILLKNWLRPSKGFSCGHRRILKSLNATDSQISVSWDTPFSGFLKAIPQNKIILMVPDWMKESCWTEAEFFSKYTELLSKTWQKRLFGLIPLLLSTGRKALSSRIAKTEITLNSILLHSPNENTQQEFICGTLRSNLTIRSVAPSTQYTVKLQVVRMTIRTVFNQPGALSLFDVILSSVIRGESTWPKAIATWDSIPPVMSEEDISIDFSYAHSLGLSWRAPKPFRGKILGYEVVENCNPLVNTTTSLGLEHTFVFKNLAAGEQFCFRFRAVTSAGAGNWSKVLTVHTKELCSRGYISIDKQGTKCKPCRENTFRDIGNSTCVSCPIDRPFTLQNGTASRDGCVSGPGFIQVGTATKGCDLLSQGIKCNAYGTSLESVELEPGYWRIANTSSDVRECDPPTFCTGNISNNYCALHHTGILCRACVPGYLIYADGCRLEGNKEGFGWPLLIVCYVVVLFLPSCWLMWSSRKRSKKSQNSCLSCKGRFTCKLLVDYQAVNKKLRIFFGFMQIFILFVGAANTSREVAFLSFPFTLDILKLFSVFPCTMQLSTFEWNAVLSISPIIVILFLYITNHIIICWLDKKSDGGRQWKKFWRVLLVLFYVAYPTIAARLLKSFLYDTFPKFPGDPNPYRSIFGDPVVEYGASIGWMCFTGLMIFLYVIGIPFLFMRFAYAYHKTQGGGRPSSSWLAWRESGSFLCEPYELECWWFEVWELFRKLLLTSLFVVLHQVSHVISISLFTLVCISSLVLVLGLSPYVSRTDSLFSEVSFTLLIVLAVITQVLHKTDVLSSRYFELIVLFLESLTFIIFLIVDTRNRGGSTVVKSGQVKRCSSKPRFSRKGLKRRAVTNV